MPSDSIPTLLSIPCEIRNAIYLLVFAPDVSSPSSDSLRHAVKLNVVASTSSGFPPSSSRLNFLRTCKQIHQEAQLLALSLTPFHVTGDDTLPELFDARCRPLNTRKVGAIRHLTLTARISHLRALNEAWSGLPFGHPGLHLDTLTIVPRRPDASASAYAEIADLSQCHTLAYIIAETLKRLKHVRIVEIRNEGCFSNPVWCVVYKSLLIRMCRWGGVKCGLRFECGDEAIGSDAQGWFRVQLPYGLDCDEREELIGNEVGDEVIRIAERSGGMPAPALVGVNA